MPSDEEVRQLLDAMHRVLLISQLLHSSDHRLTVPILGADDPDPDDYDFDITVEEGNFVLTLKDAA